MVLAYIFFQLPILKLLKFEAQDKGQIRFLLIFRVMVFKIRNGNAPIADLVHNLDRMTWGIQLHIFVFFKRTFQAVCLLPNFQYNQLVQSFLFEASWCDSPALHLLFIRLLLFLAAIIRTRPPSLFLALSLSLFLVACTRLYKSLCLSVGRLVGRSVCPTLLFLHF